MLKKTFGHAGIYGIGVLLNRAVSFIMLPVYTRFLTPSDYGILELLEITTEITALVAGIGVIHGLNKFYYEYEDQTDKDELVSTMFLFTISMYALGCLLGAGLSDRLSVLVFDSPEYKNLIVISFINLFLSFLVFVPLSYIRVRQKSLFFVIIGATKLVMQLSLNIVLVVYMGKGLVGVLISTLITNLLIGVFLTIYTFAKVSVRFSYTKSIQLVQFGYPFIFTGLGAFILTFSDRYFLNYFGELSKVGIYSLGYKFGFLLASFPVKPLLQIWQVQRFEIIKQNDYMPIFNKFLSWFSIIIISAALLISVLVEDVLRIMSAPSFWEANRVVPIILIAYIFQAYTEFFNFGLFHTGKTKQIAIGTCLSAATIILMSFLLIPHFGIYGAAWATVIGFLTRLVYVYWAAQRYFKMAYDLYRPAITLLSSIAIFLVHSYTVNHLSILERYVVSIPFSLIMFCVFIVTLMMFKVITQTEKDHLLRACRDKLF